MSDTRDEHPLTRYRRQHKLTLADFAERVQSTQSTMSRIESGARDVSAALLRRIVAATAGEVSADDIINAHPCVRR